MFFSKSKKLLKQKEEELMVVESELFTLKNAYGPLEAELQGTKQRLTNTTTALEKKNAELAELHQRYGAIIDQDKEIIKRQLEIKELEENLSKLNEKYTSAVGVFRQLENQINIYKETLDISEYGLYQPVHNFDTPEQYKLALENCYQKQKYLVAAGEAVKCYTEWEVGGSKAEGLRMTKKYSKLMLYAFNGECDSIISKVRWNNIAKAELRIMQTFNNINKLGESHNILIVSEYLQLKKEELTLTYEYEQRQYQEKEEQRRIREQMREEEKARKEYERAQREAEDEEKKFQRALDRTRQELVVQGHNQEEINALNEKIKLLESNLAEAHARKERAISLAEQTKVGHIYVISNIGSFGEDVYKIGMTRRLDPHDRVRELGDASVPFHFDVHAIIYSDNAPQLEYEIHQQFRERRLNRINQRKEFFRVTLDEIETFVKSHANAEIEFTKLAEAREFRETLTLMEQLKKAVKEAEPEAVFPGSLI